MHRASFLVILYIIALLIIFVPGQVLAETEIVFVEERIMPVPEEVLEEIDSSEAITILQGYEEQIEWQIFALVNEERQRLGKQPLQMDSALRNISRSHSKDIFDRNLFNVTPPDGSVPGHWSPATGFPQDRLASHGYTLGVHYTGLSENVASNSGHSDPGTAAFNAWMNSDGHRNTIQDAHNVGFNYTGIGVYRASNGGYYFTQKFIRAPSPLSSVVTPPTAPPPPTDPEPSAPSIPTLVSPENGSTVTGTGADSRITFKWNASTGADRYQMRLRSVGATTWQTSPNISDTHTIANNFPNDGRQYEWAIRAGNSSGQWSNWSSAWVFKNGTDAAPPPPTTSPGTPSLTSPGHGQIVHGHSAVLNWAPAANATHYAVWVHNLTKGVPVILTDPMAGTSYTLGGLANNGDVYAWSVIAFNAYNGTMGVLPDPIVFINGTDDVLLPPNLLSPAHLTYVPGSSVMFNWSESAGATHYVIWVYNLTRNETSFMSDPRTNTSIHLTGFTNNGDIYVWSVVALNAYNGEISEFAPLSLFVNK